MKGLIIKDILTIKGNLKSLLIVIVIFAMLSFTGEMNMLVMFPVYGLLLFISTFSYDEYNKWDAYAITLPNGKENVVKSKYVATILISLIATIFAILLILILTSIKPNMVLEDNIYGILGSLAGITIMQSILYPIIFKLGIEKGRISLFIVIAVITAAAAIISKYGSLKLPSSIGNFFNEYGLIIVSVLVILAITGSYFLSKKIYSNKEF